MNFVKLGDALINLDATSFIYFPKGRDKNGALIRNDDSTVAVDLVQGTRCVVDATLNQLVKLGLAIGEELL